MSINSLIPENKSYSSGTKRIQRAKDKEEIIQALLSDEVGIFKEIWRLLLFAAQVGFKNNTRETLKSVDTGKGIDQGTFGNSPAWPGILYLMALSEAGKTEFLSGDIKSEEYRTMLFQEYANGGLGILKHFFANNTPSLSSIISFIENQIHKKNNKLDLDINI